MSTTTTTATDPTTGPVPSPTTSPVTGGTTTIDTKTTVVQPPPAPIVSPDLTVIPANPNFDMPPALSTFLTSSDFKTDWRYKRLVVFYTLAGLGAAFGLITVVVLICMLLSFYYSGAGINPVIEGLLTTLIYACTSTFVAVFAGYVYGSHADTSSFRSNITSMVGTLSTGRRGGDRDH